MTNSKGCASKSVQYSQQINRLINVTIAGLLFVPSLLVIGVLYVISRLVEKRPQSPFFYCGQRLGLHKKPFVIHKIRTLREDLEFEQQGVILSAGSQRELVLGKFLRESRLDELPQLWNVLVGDMNLVGPRPLRPAMYEQLRRQLPNCEGRFRVKPGLTGYAQFLTPSRTPKRVRFAIDNYFINQGYRPGRDFALVSWTVWMVVVKTVTAALRRVVTLWTIFKKRRQLTEERLTARRQSKGIWIQLADIDFSGKTQAPVPIYDINDRAVSFYYEGDLETGETLYFYLIGSKARDTCRKKRARCCGYVYKCYSSSETSDSAARYVVFYKPISPRYRYLTDYYVLHETVA